MKNLIIVAVIAVILCVFSVPTLANGGPVFNFLSRNVLEEPNVAPKHRIDLRDLWVRGGVLHIPIEGLIIGETTGDSNLPMSGEGNLVLLTTEFDFEDIIVGDFVVIDSKLGKYLHQVVEIGSDKQGDYVETRGLNNPARDWLRARPEQITRLALGILW